MQKADSPRIETNYRVDRLPFVTDIDVSLKAMWNNQLAFP